MKLSPNRLAQITVMMLLACAAGVQAETAPENSKPAPPAQAVSPTGAAETRHDDGGVTINGRHFLAPMTGKERWNKYVRDTYTGFPIYAASLGSALGDQASNTPKPWGRTWEGYAKRVGSQYASFAIQTSVYGGGSALFRNEGRYVACQCGGGWHRAGYALQMSFLTYHNRKKVVDVPQFAAAYAAGIIPVTWYPQGYSVSAQGVQNGTYQLGFVVLVREVQEFAPELKHFFGRFKP